MRTFKRNNIGNNKNCNNEKRAKYNLRYDLTEDFSVSNICDENFFRVANAESVCVSFYKGSGIIR